MNGAILLGFDGSPDAVAAARWAAKEAAHHGAALSVLHTYDYPYLERLDHRAQEALADEAAAVCEIGRQTAADEAPGIDILPAVRVGQPAPLLIAAAEDHDLLVLGRHGRNRLHRLLLGSVANKCLHHVTCPVVIVTSENSP